MEFTQARFKIAKYFLLVNSQHIDNIYDVNNVLNLKKTDKR